MHMIHIFTFMHIYKHFKISIVIIIMVICSFTKPFELKQNTWIKTKEL